MKSRDGLLYALGAIVLLAGIFFWIEPLERDVTQSTARADIALQHALTEEHALQDRPHLRVLARRINDELNNVKIQASSSDAMESLLTDIQTVAVRDRITITAVKPSLSLDAPLGDGTEREDIDLGVHGLYRNIVFFLRDLSHMPTLASILSVQLDRSSAAKASDGSPPLDARLHIQTVRFAPTTISQLR